MNIPLILNITYVLKTNKDPKPPILPEYRFSGLKSNFLNFDLYPNNFNIEPNSFFFIIGIVFLFLLHYLSIFELFENYNDLYNAFIFYKSTILLFIIKFFWLDNLNIINEEKKKFYTLYYIFLIFLIEFLIMIILFFYYKFTILLISLFFSIWCIFFSIFVFLITWQLYNYDFQKNIEELKRSKKYEVEKDLINLKLKLLEKQTFKNDTLLNLEIKRLKKAKFSDIENKYRLVSWWRDKIVIFPDPKKNAIPVMILIHFFKPGVPQLILILFYFFYVYTCYYFSGNYVIFYFFKYFINIF